MPAISNFRMKSASPIWSAIPKPTVRQLTARRLVENAATTEMNAMMPATAWRRGLTAPRSRNAAAARPRATAPAARRSERSDRAAGLWSAGLESAMRRSHLSPARGRSALRNPFEHERPGREPLVGDRHGRREARARLVQAAPAPVVHHEDRVAGADLRTRRRQHLDADAVIDRVVE